MASSAAIALAFLTIAVANVAALTPACISNFDPKANYFPDAFSGDAFAIPVGQTVVTQANDFSVQYDMYYKLVYDKFSKLSYILYQCGAPKPANAFPTDRYFSIPVDGFTMDTTVTVPFIQMLGLASGIRQTYVPPVSPCLQRLLQEGKVTAYNMASPQAERLPLFDAQVLTAPYPLNMISFSAASDPGVLKRAEWVKYVALFFNKEARATEVFDTIVASYNCLNGSAKGASSAPAAAWLSFYENVWTVSNATYKLQYVSDATGTNVPADSARDYNMSNSADVAALHALLKTVDVVLDETYLPSGPAAYSLAQFQQNAAIPSGNAASFKFLATPNVWSIYGRHTGAPSFSTDWYESALAQPQLVLQDVLSILHPDIVPANTPAPHYFYNVGKGDTSVTVTAAMCTADPYAATSPVAVFCYSSSSNSSSSSNNNSSSSGSQGYKAAFPTATVTLSWALAALLTAALFM